MRRAPPNLWTSKQAAAASEFALVLPVILFMFAAIVEFGRIFQVYAATNRLATQFAIAWADCATACQTELNTYSSSYTIANIAPQLDPTKLTLTMIEVTMSGTTPTVVYPAGATMSASQISIAQANFASAQSGVIVTASYTHTLDFFNSLMAPILGSYLNPTYTVAQLKNYT